MLVEAAHLFCTVSVTPVPFEDVGGDAGEAHSTHPAGSGAECQLPDLIVEAYHLEQRAAPVGAEGADPHLGHDLEETVLQRHAVALLGHHRIDGHLARGGECSHLLDGQVGVHRRSPEGGQAGEVVGVPRLSGHHHQRSVEADAGVDEPVVDGTHRQQDGDGSVLGVHLTVGENDDRGAQPHRLLGLIANLRHPAPQPVGAVRSREHGRNPMGEEVRIPAAGDAFQLRIAQHGRSQLDEVRLLRGLLEQRSALAEVDPQRHDQLLPDGVHGGVGDLREQPVEVVGEPARLGGQRRQRGVVAHRPGGGLPLRHLLENQAALFRVVAEDASEALRVKAIVLECVEGILHVEGLGADPLAIGLLARQLRLDLIREENLAALAVEHQHLARSELACGLRPTLLLGAHPRFGSHQHHVWTDRPAGRSQAVAIHARQ